MTAVGLLALGAGALALAWAAARPGAAPRAAGSTVALVLLAGAATCVAAPALTATAVATAAPPPPIAEGTHEATSPGPTLAPEPPPATAAPPGPTPPSTVPAGEVAIEIRTGMPSAGVTVREDGVARASEAAIERQLGVTRLIADECAVVYGHAGERAPDATELNQACAFVRARLRLDAPPAPVPVFVRNAHAEAGGEVPMAADVVVAVNAENLGDYRASVRLLSHELTHALGGVDRFADGVCVEEGVATFVEASSVGELDDTTAAARGAAAAGTVDDPRNLRSDDAFHGGTLSDVLRHYVVCGAFVRFLVDRLGGGALIDLYFGRPPSGIAPDSLAAQFLQEMGGRP